MLPIIYMTVRPSTYWRQRATWAQVAHKQGLRRKWCHNEGWVPNLQAEMPRIFRPVNDKLSSKLRSPHVHNGDLLFPCNKVALFLSVSISVSDSYFMRAVAPSYHLCICAFCSPDLFRMPCKVHYAVSLFLSRSSMNSCIELSLSVLRQQISCVSRSNWPSMAFESALSLSVKDKQA